MKIKRLSSIEWILLLIIILDSNIFYLVHTGGLVAKLNSPFNKYLILALVFVALSLMPRYIGRYLWKNKEITYGILYIFFSMILISIYSMIKYNESFIDVFTCWYHFLLIFLVIPIEFEMSLKNGKRYIYDIIVACSSILCFISIVQAVIYNHNGSVFLPGLVEDMISIRHGNLRLSTCSVNNLAFVILVSKLLDTSLNAKNRFFSLILVLIEAFTYYYVYMSRSYIVILAGISVIIYYFRDDKEKVKRFLVVIITGIIIMSAVDMASFVESFSINTKAGTALSTVNRLGAYSYFFQKIVENPLFGIGFIRDSFTNLNNILHGPTGSYYVSDIGFIGVLAEMGILGFGVFAYFSALIIKYVYVTWKNKLWLRKIECAILIGMSSVWFLTSINVIVTNPRNSLSMPFIIAIASNIYKKSKEVRCQKCEICLTDLGDIL